MLHLFHHLDDNFDHDLSGNLDVDLDDNFDLICGDLLHLVTSNDRVRLKKVKIAIFEKVNHLNHFSLILKKSIMIVEVKFGKLWP